MAASCALQHRLSCSLPTIAKHESTFASTSQQSSCLSFCCGQSFSKERRSKRLSAAQKFGSASIHRGAVKQPAPFFQRDCVTKGSKKSRRVGVRANADSENSTGSEKVSSCGPDCGRCIMPSKSVQDRKLQTRRYYGVLSTLQNVREKMLGALRHAQLSH